MNLNVFALEFMGTRLSEAPCLRVPKALGERAISLARSLLLFESELRVKRLGDYLYIPLKRVPSPKLLQKLKENLSKFEISTHRFHEQVKRPLKLLEALEDRLPSHLLASLPQAIDFVGDIAVLEVPPELKGYERVIGESIMKTNKRVQTVLAKSGAVKGVYRLREFEVIAGLEKTETAHREHGCVYHVDLSKAYFSPRLSYEHQRVASQVKNGETVLDMFAGVGPFSILIAKQHKDVDVYAVDVNPDAFHYLKKNVAANHVEKEVKVIIGNVKEVVDERLTGVADRVIMNLPEKALEYIKVACSALKHKGGVMHYYEFASAPNPYETAKARLRQVVKQNNRQLKILLTRTVRATAPFTWQVAVDAEIH